MASAPKAAPAQASAKVAAPSQASAPAAVAAPAPSAGGGKVMEFKLPDIGEGIAEGEIVRWMINDGVVNETIDVCAPFDYSIDQIVGAFEQLTGKKALANRVEHGSATITNRLRIAEVPIDFSGDYLGAVIRRYYA